MRTTRSAADYTTDVTSAELANSTTDFTNTIVFSQGCHSGYNLVDVDGIPQVSDTLDWAQAFAQKGATLIAGTGYQYGDSDLVAYSEAIYANFSKQLLAGSGPVSVGDALVAAKKAYLAATPNPRLARHEGTPRGIRVRPADAQRRLPARPGYVRLASATT